LTRIQVRECLHTRFVILNEVKNPSGTRQRYTGSGHPTGFFAALRMTGFESLNDLKTPPGRARGKAHPEAALHLEAGKTGPMC
jgi:hypothetical protein